MTARINQERVEREALEQQRLELQKRKQKLIAENKKRRDDLANLDKDLEKFIDVRSPRTICPGASRWIWTNRNNRRRNRSSSSLKRLLEGLTIWEQRQSTGSTTARLRSMAVPSRSVCSPHRHMMMVRRLTTCRCASTKELDASQSTTQPERLVFRNNVYFTTTPRGREGV